MKITRIPPLPTAPLFHIEATARELQYMRWALGGVYPADREKAGFDDVGAGPFNAIYTTLRDAGLLF